MASANKNSMRGLTVFISDIRAAQSKEGEEKRVNKEMAKIRKEFKEAKNLDGYARRKYVCKLLYMYILGYDLDFGHMEAVTLLSSNKFQEKSIGYLALGMLLNESHEMIPLIINSLQEDLQSRADYFQCLALTAIANIGGKEMAESLAPLVQKLLVANTSPPHIKKRAAQALLKMFKKYPSVLSPDTSADKILAIFDDTDAGVLTSFTAFLLGVIQESSKGWEAAVPKVIGVLARFVISRDYSKDYVYYSIPAPWLQVLLLRVLRQFPAPPEGAITSKLSDILTAVFNSADNSKSGGVNQRNVLNSILFEAIHLVIHYEGNTGPFQAMLKQAAALLGRFLSAKETNIRYLSLEAMGHLASLSPEMAGMIKKYQDTVVISLRDVDISIRRRALDLLYTMCDRQSSKTIVGELLTYLVTADYQIREELVLKIAALAEKYASNYAWYVDVILQLISTAGDHVSDPIWYRVVKIVTNHEDIQEYAARTVFAALSSASCHEATVKVGGYILGEFGHLIAEQPGSSPTEQFQVLQSKFHTVDQPTRALLLTTYAKMVNLFPEVTRSAQDVFRQHQGYIDAEIQQRAVEYYQLSVGSEQLMQTVLDVIPAWNETDPSASGSSGSLVGDTTPEIKSKPRSASSANLTRSPQPSAAQDILGLGLGIDSPDAGGMMNPNNGGRMNSGGIPPAAAAAAALSSSPAGDPFGLAINTISTPGNLAAAIAAATNQQSLMSSPTNPSTSSSFSSGAFPSGTSSLSQPNFGVQTGSVEINEDQKMQAMYRRLCLASEGVLYEDGMLQVGMKSEYQREHGRIMLFYGNSSITPLNNFRSGISSPPQIQAQLQPVANTVPPKAQVQQLLTFVCTGDFVDPPTLQLSFLTSTRPVNLTIRLPVVATKFVELLRISGPDFFNSWKQYTGKPFETQEVFKSSRPLDMAWITKVLQDGLHLCVLKGVDPSINNLVATGTFHSASGQVAALVRLESNPQASMVRLTIRTSSGTISTAIQQLIVSQLSN